AADLQVFDSRRCHAIAKCISHAKRRWLEIGPKIIDLAGVPSITIEEGAMKCPIWLANRLARCQYFGSGIWSRRASEIHRERGRRRAKTCVIVIRKIYK